MTNDTTFRVSEAYFYETEHGALVGCASDIFPVGFWPDSIEVKGVRYASPVFVRDRDNDVVGVDYFSAAGRKLHVIND